MFGVPQFQGSTAACYTSVLPVRSTSSSMQASCLPKRLTLYRIHLHGALRSPDSLPLPCMHGSKLQYRFFERNVVIRYPRNITGQFISISSLCKNTRTVQLCSVYQQGLRSLQRLDTPASNVRSMSLTPMTRATTKPGRQAFIVFTTKTSKRLQLGGVYHLASTRPLGYRASRVLVSQSFSCPVLIKSRARATGTADCSY